MANTSSEFMHNSAPGNGALAGVPPATIKICSAVRVAPSLVLTVFLSVKLAVPVKY